jgi:hypothetical protein
MARFQREADKPRLWSERRLVNGINNGMNYSVIADGKRAVVFAPSETQEAQQGQNHVIFLENFFDELQRIAPVGKQR